MINLIWLWIHSLFEDDDEQGWYGDEGWGDE